MTTEETLFLAGSWDVSINACWRTISHLFRELYHRNRALAQSTKVSMKKLQRRVRRIMGCHLYRRAVSYCWDFHGIINVTPCSCCDLINPPEFVLNGFRGCSWLPSSVVIV